MRSSQEWSQGFERDPVGTGKKAVWAFVFFIIALTVVIGSVGWVLGWFSEAAQVTQEQFGPRAGLKKYEWFVEQSNAITKMDQDVELFKSRKTNLKDEYMSYGEDRAKWPPHIQVEYNRQSSQVRDDLVAVLSQRNNLVRDYNAASEKFNWAPFNTKDDKPPTTYEKVEAE
ncbi:MAG: hypothetical protein Q7S15_00065 [bacterium]|nr:hypothetical protein [bacterium]